MREDDILDLPTLETVSKKNKPLFYLLLLSIIISVSVQYVLGGSTVFRDVLAIFLFANLDFFFQVFKKNDTLKKVALVVNLIGAYIAFVSILSASFFAKDMGEIFVIGLFVLVLYFMTFNRSEKSDYALVKVGFSFYGIAYAFFCMVTFFKFFGWPEIMLLHFLIVIFSLIAVFFFFKTYLKDKEKNWNLLLFLPKLLYLIFSVLPRILPLS